LKPHEHPTRILSIQRRVALRCCQENGWRSYNLIALPDALNSIGCDGIPRSARSVAFGILRDSLPDASHERPREVWKLHSSPSGEVTASSPSNERRSGKRSKSCAALKAGVS